MMSLLVAFTAWVCAVVLFEVLLIRVAAALLRRRLAADHPVLRALCDRHRAALGPRRGRNGEDSSSNNSSDGTRGSGAAGSVSGRVRGAARRPEDWQAGGCFAAALALRWLLGLGLWQTVGTLMVALVGYEAMAVLWLGIGIGTGLPRQQPGATGPGERAAGGNDGVPLAGGPGGHAVGTGAAVDAPGQGQGDSGQCCVCLESRAVLGFVHEDVVHCCLCAGCEAELKRKGKLGICLICKRPPLAVTKVVLA